MIDLRHAVVALACWAASLGALAAVVDAAGPTPGMRAVARCSWDRPGHNPFIGEVVPAVDRYADIPAAVRARLKERIAARRYDEIVEIRRDAISGRHSYRPEIRDMHFGVDRVCREVTRSGWSDAMRERGLVYCEGGHCILVPTVCRNVSRIERMKPAGVAGESIDPAPAAAAPAPGAAPAEALPATAGDPPAGGPSFADGVAATPVDFGSWVPEDPAGGSAAGGPGLGGGSGGGFVPALVAFNGGGGFGGDGPPGRPAAWAPVAPSTDDGPIFPGGHGGGVGAPILDRIVGGDGQTPAAVSPVPEASTWAGLLAGMALLGLNALRQRRAGVPRCATQKRS